jgi:hypothetical protein
MRYAENANASYVPSIQSAAVHPDNRPARLTWKMTYPPPPSKQNNPPHTSMAGSLLKKGSNVDTDYLPYPFANQLSVFVLVQELDAFDFPVDKENGCEAGTSPRSVAKVVKVRSICLDRDQVTYSQGKRDL